MTDSLGVFPFGAPLAPYARPPATGPTKAFVLGAYPSALHVEWTPPGGAKGIQALPVDNEPEPFWNGDDLLKHFERWRARDDVKIVGDVEPVEKWNGPSGKTLDERYLKPLDADRSAAWITDCLPLYCMSAGVRKALGRTKFDELMDANGVPRPLLPTHPSESQIVQRSEERDAQIVGELAKSKAESVVTLGNAAAIVLHRVLDLPGRPLKLQQEGYGSPVRLDVPHACTWYPLVHPGLLDKNKTWSKKHLDWENAI